MQRSFEGILIPRPENGDDPSDEAVFGDPRLGPWDGQWEMDSILVEEGEWVVRFASNVVEGENRGLEYIDDRPLAQKRGAALVTVKVNENCDADGERVSRRLPPCDQAYLDRLEEKAKEDAKERADGQCKSGGCDGSSDTETKKMKLKDGPLGLYCKYEVLVNYDGTCY